ncbi:MAG: NAD-dependent epimerase/dehydratase family protein [Mycobacteriales bacterium]
MNVLVTGGCGFIGAALVQALLERGESVAVVDVRGPFPDPRVRSVVGDIRDAGVVDEAVAEGTQAVVHLAARTSVLGSLAAPAETFEVNSTATASLLELARQREAGRFVFASTNAVVGSGVADGELISESARLSPLTPYGASKAAAEMAVCGYAAAYGLQATVLRLTNVYGRGMLAAGKDSIVPRLLRAAATGRGIDVYGDGEQVRDYVFLPDVLRAVLAGLGGAISGTVVLGSGRSVSVLELVDLAARVSGSKLPIRHVGAKPGEMRAVRVDISRARALGVAPRIDLASGLLEVWQDVMPPA